MQDSSIPTPSRILRYSGSDRPACRMNQTGVWLGVSPRAAARKAGWRRAGCRWRLSRANLRRSGGVAAHRHLPRLTYCGAMVARHETHPESGAGPAEFRAAVASMRAASLRPEVFCEEMPAPQRIAPYSSALSADVTVDDVDLGTGRIILLHDPAGNDAWNGTFRCVAYARAEIDPELISDPMLAAVGWSWLSRGPRGPRCGVRRDVGHRHERRDRELRRHGGRGGHRPDRGPRVLDARAPPTRTSRSTSVRTSRRGPSCCAPSAGLPPVPEGVTAIPSRRGQRGS